MDHDFISLMAKKTDEELITILTVRKEDYAVAVLDAAQQEFDKRDIPKDRIEQVEQEQSLVKEKENELANEPLESDIKIMAMVVPLIARMMYAEKFRKGGYERKLAEMGAAYWKGRLILFSAIIVLIVLIESFR